MRQISRWISDPIMQSGLGVAKLDGGLPVLCDKWLCKVKGRSINEIAAYQIAAKIGLPVPDHRFFVLCEHRVIDSTRFNEGDVGMLIERIDHDRRTDFEALLREKPDASVDILTFLLFDRFEHCDILWNGATHWIIDLERQFPDFTGLNDAAHLLNRKCYSEQTKEALGSCLKLAREANIEVEFFAASKRLLQSIKSFEFDFTGYSRASKASEHFSLGITQRTAILLNLIKEIEMR